MELRNRALILDNNPINSELLVEILEQINIDSKVLYSAEDLFDVIEQESYDVIFLDVMMPFMNGYEVLEALSKNPVSQNIPVIFLSALSETKNIVKGLELGCYDYITTPYCIEELQAKIKNILKLKRLQDERDCFIETLTHDLKTPVRSEIRAMELLLEGHFGELKSTQVEVLEEILNSSNYMFFMLDSILSKYKFDQNKIKLIPVRFSINSLVQDCVQELRVLFETKKQNVNICSENTSDEVNADYLAIKRTVINLLSNAIKFSKENATIEIRIFDTDEDIKISFVDRGKGIDSQDISNIFEYKKENCRKFRQVGSGLGLYISQKIIGMHGGQINVKSKKGEGSNFTISLPKKKVHLPKEAVLL
ncbi:MAG: hybrid sensor histidine kinase/response regulator [Candidatus Gastranaerophilales bacterium]|nr:hybrid sensor histidine kinase/response regulator [Candidatus Gastranaerophilales bacterium]